MTVEPCLYTLLGEDDGWTHVMPTAHTVSVWADTMQHGGPPSALLVWAIERAGLPAGAAISRITVDILGAVGLGENRVRARTVRAGRRISLVESVLDVRTPGGEFRSAARASAWILATGDTTVIASPGPAVTVPDGPGDERPAGWADHGWGDTGFIAAIDVVGLDGPGPAWLRSRHPLIGGHGALPYSTLCCLVDVANGLGSSLSARHWQWMNTDTTIHLARRPAGAWVGITADLVAGPDGYGFTAADLFDGSGPVGRSSQTVLIARQDPAHQG